MYFLVTIKLLVIWNSFKRGNKKNIVVVNVVYHCVVEQFSFLTKFGQFNLDEITSLLTYYFFLLPYDSSLMQTNLFKITLSHSRRPPD